MKISNFRFFVRKIFQNFSISNFENGFSSWKNNIFCSGFFSWQDMIILHRKMSPALSLFDLSQERNGQTSTNPWILPSSDTFSREASYVTFLSVLGNIIVNWIIGWTNHTIRALSPYRSARGIGTNIQIWSNDDRFLTLRNALEYRVLWKNKHHLKTHSEQPPGAAGSRSEGLRPHHKYPRPVSSGPATRVDRAMTSENVSSRKTCQEVSYQGGAGGTLFLYTSRKRSSKRMPKKQQYLKMSKIGICIGSTQILLGQIGCILNTKAKNVMLFSTTTL